MDTDKALITYPMSEVRNQIRSVTVILYQTEAGVQYMYMYQMGEQQERRSFFVKIYIFKHEHCIFKILIYFNATRKCVSLKNFNFRSNLLAVIV